MTDLDKQHADNAERRYAYDFDYAMHRFMLREWGITGEGCALEMGCYKGAFTKMLLNLFAEVTVVEGSGELIYEASRNAPRAHYRKRRFEEYTPEGWPHAFDSIFLIHALEHVDEPDVVLRRAATWLDYGGRLYVAVPNAFAASRQIAVEMGKLPHPWSIMDGEAQQGHRRTYDLTYLKRTVTDAGLKIVDSGGIFFKAMSNHQMDLAHGYGVIDDAYLEGAFQFGKRYPELCASIYCVAEA